MRLFATAATFILFMLIPSHIFSAEKPRTKEEMVRNIRSLPQKFQGDMKRLTDTIVEFSPPRIGVGIEISEDEGGDIFVERVYSNSPAAGKIEIDDIITAVDDIDNPRVNQVYRKVWTNTPGVKVRLVVSKSSGVARTLTLETVVLRPDKTEAGNRILEKVRKEEKPLLDAVRAKTEQLAAGIESEAVPMEKLERHPLVQETIRAIETYKKWRLALYEETLKLLEIK